MSKEIGELLQAQLRVLRPGDSMKPVIRAQIAENNALLRIRRSEEIARRSAELARLQAIPHRILFTPIEVEATVEHASELGRFVRDSFLGEVGDEAPVREVFPKKQPEPPHGFHIDAALDERWASVYQQLGKADKHRVTRAFELLESHIRGGNPRYYPDSENRVKKGQVTMVGEVRALTKDGLSALPTYNFWFGFGPQVSAVLYSAFSRPPSLPAF